MLNENNDVSAARRDALRLLGRAAMIAGGLPLLSACGDGGSTPSAGATPSSAPTAPGPLPPGPDYTATDTDRLNFALQLNYLFAAYLFRGVFGTTLPAGATSGTGSGGSVVGGTQVTLAGPTSDSLREVAYNVQAQIGYLRRVLGSAAVAQPAISIAGGASGPFQAIASTTAFPTSAPFDPYVSDRNYLIGAVGLAGVISTGMVDIVRLISDTGQRTAMIGMMTAAAQHETMIRYELFARGQAATPLYAILDQMSDARDVFDGRSDLDLGVGNQVSFIAIATFSGATIRRTPEQVLAVLFANQASVTSGAFFPNGLNGVIRASGVNQS